MTDQKKTLKDYGVKDGDMVMMDRIRRQQRPAPAPGSGGGGFNFDFSQIQIPSNLRGGSSGGAGPSQTRPQPQVMNADPFDLEAQRIIAQEIEQKNIDQNMELAMEA